MVGAHLVGSLEAPDAETAMRTATGILGRHLHAVTDGETGDRSTWIFGQIAKLCALDGIELADLSDDEVPQLAIDPTVSAIPARALGYADAAEASYAVFEALRDDRAIPRGVKFQVSIPTPYATVVAWLPVTAQEAFFPIYADAIATEVRDIVRSIDRDDLVLQYDVAVELGVLTGAMPAAGNLADKAYVVRALSRALDDVPAGVERGLHLCYGDCSHRPFVAPQDLSLCVDLVNGVDGAADFVHMPVDREAGRDPAYHEPLRELTAVPKRLALGVIDYEGDPRRTRELVAAASAGSGGMTFAVATGCGMARIDERGPDGPTLEQLLALHAEVAAPVR